MEVCPWTGHVSSSCYLTRLKVQDLSAAAETSSTVAACYDDFLSKLSTPWPICSASLESWPPSCRPPLVYAGWASNSSVKLTDVEAMDDKEAGGSDGDGA